MRKKLIGTVLSDSMAKTRVVSVDRLARHPFYKKVMKIREKFYAHDEQNSSHRGDRVQIESSRPLSRLKRWRVIQIIKK